MSSHGQCGLGRRPGECDEREICHVKEEVLYRNLDRSEWGE